MRLSWQAWQSSTSWSSICQPEQSMEAAGLAESCRELCQALSSTACLP